jgi:hypothetical protein
VPIESSRRRSRLAEDGLLDRDVLHRHVSMETLSCCPHLLDVDDDVYARNHSSEHGTAPALRRLRGVVEQIIVRHVDEQLRGNWCVTESPSPIESTETKRYAVTGMSSVAL